MLIKFGHNVTILQKNSIFSPPFSFSSIIVSGLFNYPLWPGFFQKVSSDWISNLIKYILCDKKLYHTSQDIVYLIISLIDIKFESVKPFFLALTWAYKNDLQQLFCDFTELDISGKKLIWFDKHMNESFMMDGYNFRLQVYFFFRL